MTLSDFDDIRPCSEDEMRPAFESLLADRQFDKILNGFLPLPKGMRNGLLRLLFRGIKTPLDFQKRLMKPIVYYVFHKATSGHSCHFPKSLDRQKNYLFMSNHRDIVLDSAFLDVLLMKEGFSTSVEIAIGNNLLIHPWIKTFVRMNKSFIVNRGLTPMLNMGGPTSGKTTADIIANLRDLNIVPLAISYEYDPCDFLKAKEFQCKRDVPGWKKSKQDDLDNMKTGIWGQKGHVHYQAADCINDWLDSLDPTTIDKADLFSMVAEHIDHEIHRNYRIYDINRDALSGKTNAYIESRIKMVDIDNPDTDFIREKITAMYANPLRNHEEAIKQAK